MELRGAEVRIQPRETTGPGRRHPKGRRPSRAPPPSRRCNSATSGDRGRWGALALSRCVPFALACTFACDGPSADRFVLRGSRSLPWVRSRARVSDAFVPALAPRSSREQAGNPIPLPASQRFVNLSGSGVFSSWPSLNGS